MPRLVCTRRRFCDRMEERLNPFANHGKGLTEFRLTKMRSGKSFRAGVMYKMKESDRGLLLTHCPWCGTQLLELFRMSGVSGEKAPDYDFGKAT